MNIVNCVRGHIVSGDRSLTQADNKFKPVGLNQAVAIPEIVDDNLPF